MQTVNYETKTEGERKIHTAKWSVFISNNNTTREFRTSNSKKFNDFFQLKMQFIDNGKKTMEIYYLSPNPVFVKVTLISVTPEQPQPYQYQRQILNYQRQILASKEFHRIDANKWENLASLTYAVDTRFNLDFEFIFFKVIKVPETELSNDFQNLLNKILFSDVTMKSDEGTEYQVHKAVLASRSAVLKAHFDHNPTANIVESPFESEILNEVLTFIYSAQVPKMNEIPEKLLAAADYYQLNKLKSLCEEALHKKLTLENAVDILQLAYLHSANILLEQTLQFIKDGHAKAITKTEEWTKISPLELIKIIYEHNVDDVVYINVVYQVDPVMQTTTPAMGLPQQVGR